MSRLTPRLFLPENLLSFRKIGNPEALPAPCPLRVAGRAGSAAAGWTLIVGLNAAGPLAASGARGVAAAQGSKRQRNEARVTNASAPKGPEQAETGDNPSIPPWPGSRGCEPCSTAPSITRDPGSRVTQFIPNEFVNCTSPTCV